MNKNGKLVTTDEEKTEVLGNFFALVFTGNLSSHSFQVHLEGTSRQGLGEQSHSHCKGRLGSSPPEEQECT